MNKLEKVGLGMLAVFLLVVIIANTDLKGKFFSIYMLGGDSGSLPFGGTVYVELDPGKTSLSGCSAYGMVSSVKEISNCRSSSAYFSGGRWYCPRCPDGSMDGEPGDGCAPCCDSVMRSPGSLEVVVNNIVVGRDSGSGERSFSISVDASPINGYLGLPQNYASMSQSYHTKGSFGISLNGVGYVRNFQFSCGEDTCQPSWSCGSWSDCDGSKRTRSCTDNVCGGSKTEDESCTWECLVNTDCKDCFKTCVNHECVITKRLVAAEKDCGVWKGYPSCVFDYSNCPAERPVEPVKPLEPVEPSIWQWLWQWFLNLFR